MTGIKKEEREMQPDQFDDKSNSKISKKIHKKEKLKGDFLKLYVQL